MINSALIDQEIDIGAVRRYQVHELITHFKMYGSEVFLHVSTINDKLKVGKLHRVKKDC